MTHSEIAQNSDVSSSSNHRQQTLANAIELQGVGLHSGTTIRCRLLPAPVNNGKVFVRVDLAGHPQVKATLAATSPSQLSTLLRQGDAEVRTIEHLMAALAGCGVDNCRIELDGPEVPILDGSALPWVEAIEGAGLQPQAGDRPFMQLRRPLTVWQDDAFVSAIPSPVTRFSYGIDFPACPIGEQWFSWEESISTFVRDIAPARTFTTEANARKAMQVGLIKGGSLENAIVCSETDWLTPLRFDDEPVRHKLIDLLGDLSLTGVRWQAHFIAYKASHTLHGLLAQQLLDGDLGWVKSNLEP